MNTKHRGRLILLAAVGLASAGCSAARGPGQIAPDFQLNNLAGQSVSLSQFKGHVVLLGFWAVG